MQGDLETFFPEPVKVPTRLGPVNVDPMPMSKLGKFSRLISPAMPLLSNGDFKAAIEDHYEHVRDALVVATPLTAEELDRLLSDDFVALLVVVVEANLDFFVQRLVPQLRRLVALLRGSTAGQTSLPTSSAPDIGSATSVA